MVGPMNAEPQHVAIAADSAADQARFVDIITEAFSATPLTTAFIVDIDSTPPPYPSPSVDHARRRRHFSKGILDSAHAGAELVHAGDWSAIALWEPPSFTGKPFIDSKDVPGPLLSEWRARVRAAKAKYLAVLGHSTPDSASTGSAPSPANSSSARVAAEAEAVPAPQIRPFFHLSFLARNPSAPRVMGSIGAVIAPFMQRARAEHAPAWLEATTPQAVRLYERFGFRVVEEIVVGKGKLDARGWPAENGMGEGVTAWAMIYDEHLQD